MTLSIHVDLVLWPIACFKIFQATFKLLLLGKYHFYWEGGSLKLEDQVLFLDQKGGLKDFLN